MKSNPVHADGGSYVLTKLASEHAVLAATANSADGTGDYPSRRCLWSRQPTLGDPTYRGYQQRTVYVAS